MRQRFAKGVLCLFLAAMLTGCFQLQINGSVSGATVTITQLDGAGGTIVIGPSEGDEYWVATLGEEAWQEFLPLVRILFTGFITIPNNIDIDPQAYYLATASGGVDNDPMRTKDLTDAPVPVTGEWHTIVKGERILKGNLKISIITEAIYQVLKPELPGLTNQQIKQRLDELTATALNNVDKEPEVNYEDALRFSLPIDDDKYRGEPSRLGELADLYETDEWDEEEVAALSRALIEDKDPEGTERITVCATVIHQPPLTNHNFPLASRSTRTLVPA